MHRQSTFAGALAATALSLAVLAYAGGAAAETQPRIKPPVANTPVNPPKVPPGGYFTKVDVMVNGYGYVRVGEQVCGHDAKHTVKCTFTVPKGSAVTFVSDPVVGAYLDHWYGACAEQNETSCTIVPSAESLVGAAFVKGKP